VLYRLGKIWLANAQPSKAETLWQQILTAYPATGMARMAQLQVARLYESKGDLQVAISAYQTYLEMLAREEDTRYYRLAAYAHLIDLQNRTGRATLSAQLAQNALDTARSTGDPELLLDLSQYYWRSGHKELGKQLLQDGLHALAPMQKQGGTGGDLLRLEFKIFRRLYELGEYRTLLERWRNLEALRDDPTTRRHYWGCCAYYAALSLHRQGDIRSAKLLLSSGLEALESDAELTAQFVSALAMYTHWSEGVETARPLYEWAIAEQPRSVVANFGLLYLAVWEFNEGRVIEALSKAERILAVTKLKKGWRDTGDLLWSAQYVRGCCLKEMGMHREATALIAEAKRQKPNLAVYELLAGGE
jgi:tetratricopeptide (TPR) repeat protein